MAIAEHRGSGHECLAEGLDRFECLAFLDESDNRIDEHDAEDHPRVDPVVEHRRDDHGDQQDVDQRLVELEQKPHRLTLSPARGEHIEAVPIPSLGRLRR